MRRLAVVSLSIALALIAVPASARGGAAKVPIHNTTITGGFCPIGPLVPNPASDSFVVLNTAGKPGDANKVIANIQLKSGAPSTTYDIFVFGPLNCLLLLVPNGGTLTTNAGGHGHANVHLDGIDAAGGPHPFMVQLNARVGPFIGPPPAEFTSGVALLD